MSNVDPLRRPREKSAQVARDRTVALSPSLVLQPTVSGGLMPPSQDAEHQIQPSVH
jgi:hypothetical protein